MTTPESPTRTRMWTGSIGASAETPTAARTCPQCRGSFAGHPFCVRDGTLEGGAFQVGGRYRVEETLGAGGMSLVFGARHELLGKPVALKILRQEAAADPSHTQRFLREARISSQLHHENIVAVTDFGFDEALGVHYLVMERLWGKTLAEELRATGPLPWRRAVEILLPLARALASAHEQGVIHRDLNPRNVYLVQTSGRQDVVKLCDFGLSRMSGADVHVTVAGLFVGTPAYMSPEQIRGDAAQAPAVDLYALGVTAYEMLTGRLPHEAPTPVALVARKLTDEPTALASHALPGDLPPGLDALIMRCLSREPEARPASALAFERELTQLVAGASEAASGAASLVGQFAGCYQLDSLIGAGGVGWVYLAKHPLIGTKVAVKVLLPEVAALPGMLERFMDEARSTSQIDSPSLPRYLDFGHLPGGQPFAVMEFLDGETVAQRLARSGPLPIDVALRLLGQIADALGRAHERGIVHRDIKPENLFIVTDPHGQPAIKVLDFGIAKLMVPRGSARLTTAGYILGTPYYAAPEQLLGADVGPAADIYALGATAFEMLSGRRPFEGDIPRLLKLKTSESPPSLAELRPEVPAAVVDAVRRMLASEPAARPASMAEVGTLLMRRDATPFADDSDDTQLPIQRPAKWPRILITASVVIAVVVPLFIALRPAPAPVTEPVPVTAPAPATVTAPVPATVTAPAPAPVTAPVPATVTAPVPATVTAPAPAPVVAEPARPPRKRTPTPPRTPTPSQRRPAPAGTPQDVILGDPFQ